jgi:hypothetical protein
MFRKYAGDMIAQEMYKILKKAEPKLEDKADCGMADDAKDEMTDDAKDEMTDDAKDEMSDDAEDEMTDDASDSWDASSFITSEEPPDNADDSMNKAMDSMSNYADDDKMTDDASDSHNSDKNIQLMKGLGKIEASLRRKGENFAADLVQVTAKEVKSDIIKEARNKEMVKIELVKMASRLSERGERKAAAMVRDTILKISK